MHLNQAQFERIKASLPRERGGVKIGQLDFLNAMLYVVENGCKWRQMPKEYGPWHTIYTRMMRWAKNGVLARVFAELQTEGILAMRPEVLSLDSTSLKVHPDAHGALKKKARKRSENRAADGTPKFIWWPQMIGKP
jgi:transposase